MARRPGWSATRALGENKDTELLAGETQLAVFRKADGRFGLPGQPRRPLSIEIRIDACNLITCNLIT